MTRKIAQILKLAVVAGAAAMSIGGMTGCNQTSHAARNAVILYHTGDFAAAAAELKPNTTKKDENFVLNNCRYGSCALAAGDLAGAETAFMSAYEVINGVNTNDGGRTMGAVLVFEGVKVWKGEPFERAMAHYYLGLVFLLKHDYENARAAFQNSLFKLREYSNSDDPNAYRATESNFALGYFGLGYCYMKLGKADLAQQNFKIAATLDPYLANVIQAAQQPGVNALVFVDAGQGPRLAPKGWYNEESAFGPTPAEVGPIPPVGVYLDGKLINPTNVKFSMVDTLALAQEKRWQDIDTIRKTKAAIGTGLIAGGAGATAYGAHSRDRTAEWAGLGAMVAGTLLVESSKADLRYWEMLPRTVYIVPMTLPPGPHTISANAGGAQSGQINVPPGGAGGTGAPGAVAGDQVFYFRLP